jgi:hypothetical protein
MAASTEIEMLELTIGPAADCAVDEFVASGTVSAPTPAAVFEPVGEWCVLRNAMHACNATSPCMESRGQTVLQAHGREGQLARPWPICLHDLG